MKGVSGRFVRRFALLFVTAAIASAATIAGCGGQKEPPPAQKLTVELLTTQQGLPHNFITALVTFNNQVWAGTKNGLARFDGVNWQISVLKNTNALGSNLIENLSIGENAVWIATDNGVCRSDGTNWSSILTGTRARAVVSSGSQIAVATAHGVEYSTGAAFAPLSKENAALVYDEVQALGFDASGRLWAGTRAGMGLLSGQMFQTYTGPAQQPMGSSLVDIPPLPPSCQLIGNNINVIIPFRGKLAIGTTSGVSLTDMGTQWTSYTAPHKKWIQRAGKILEEVTPGNSPLTGPSVTALAAAPADAALFIGTNKGLSILKDDKWLELDQRLSRVPTGPITGVTMSGSDLWVGTQNGLYRIIGISSLLTSAPQ